MHFREWIFLQLIEISVKFVPKGGPINNIPPMVQIMAWRRKVIILTNADPIQWRIYVGKEELQ